MAFVADIGPSGVVEVRGDGIRSRAAAGIFAACVDGGASGAGGNDDFGFRRELAACTIPSGLVRGFLIRIRHAGTVARIRIVGTIVEGAVVISLIGRAGSGFG